MYARCPYWSPLLTVNTQIPTVGERTQRPITLKMSLMLLPRVVRYLALQLAFALHVIWNQVAHLRTSELNLWLCSI